MAAADTTSALLQARLIETRLLEARLRPEAWSRAPKLHTIKAGEETPASARRTLQVEPAKRFAIYLIPEEAEVPVKFS
jgi:hypothetical protein